MNLVSNENKFFKNDLSSHVCHISSAPSTTGKHVACSTSFSIIENDICALKKSIDCLGSTSSKCIMNHTRLKFMLHKKHAPHMHTHKLLHTHAHHAHKHDFMYAHVYTCTHCDVRAIL